MAERKQLNMMKMRLVLFVVNLSLRHLWEEQLFVLGAIWGNVVIAE